MRPIASAAGPFKEKERKKWEKRNKNGGKNDTTFLNALMSVKSCTLPTSLFRCYTQLKLSSLSLSSNLHIFQSKTSQGTVHLPTTNSRGFATVNKAESWVPDLPNARRGSVCPRRQTLVGTPCVLFICSKTTPGDHSLLVGRHYSYLPCLATEESTRLHWGLSRYCRNRQ